MTEEHSREQFLVFGSPMIEEPEIEEVVDSLRSGWISTGPKVARFEELFRQHTGSTYAKAVNSCTAGLHLSLLVAGIGPGDEVITTPLTFAATANVIVHAGATPVFVDVDRSSMNIEPSAIEAAITPRTRALIPVHFAGRPCDMDRIMEIARRHDLVVIEDAAHAVEASYHGRSTGTFGDLGCFSFYVTKNLVTGEGGMVVTEREDWATELERYALHGLSRGAWKRYSDEGFKHYEVVHPGSVGHPPDRKAGELPRSARGGLACLRRRIRRPPGRHARTRRGGHCARTTSVHAHGRSRRSRPRPQRTSGDAVP
jgi:dTDP-4-amino-4,6-dideoxygalactose transaminase